MASYLTTIGAAMGTLLGVANAGWSFWKAYQDRASLRVEVKWDCWSWGIEPKPERYAAVTIINSGGRVVYIQDICLAELKEDKGILPRALHLFRKTENNEHLYVLQSLEDGKLDPGKNLPCNVSPERPEFGDPENNPYPQLRNWENLRVIVRAQSGKRWQSKPPSQKPSWFSAYESEPPAIPPGVSRCP